MKAISVFKVTLKGWFRSKSGVFFSFLFPLILLLMFGAIFGGSGTAKYGIYVQNLDAQDGIETDLSAAFIDALNSTNALSIGKVPAGVDPVDYIKSASPNMKFRLLIIPSGFANMTMNGSFVVRMNITYQTLNVLLQQYSEFIPQNQSELIAQGMGIFAQQMANATIQEVDLTFVYDPTDQSAMITRGIVTSVATAFNYGLIGASEVIQFEDETITQKSLKSADYYMPGFITAFIMTNGVMGLASNIADLRRKGVMRRLLSTPMTKTDWIIGNIMTQVVVGFVLTGVMIAAGYIVFGTVPAFDWMAVVILLTGIAAFSGLGMIIGGLVKNVEATSAIGNVVAFPMMFLSGSFWMLDAMPKILQDVAKVLPLTYFSEAFRGAMIYKDIGVTFFNLGILALWAVALIVLGVIFVKWRER